MPPISGRRSPPTSGVTTNYNCHHHHDHPVLRPISTTPRTKITFSNQLCGWFACDSQPETGIPRKSHIIPRNLHPFFVFRKRNETPDETPFGRIRVRPSPTCFRWNSKAATATTEISIGGVVRTQIREGKWKNWVVVVIVVCMCRCFSVVAVNLTNASALVNGVEKRLNGAIENDRIIVIGHLLCLRCVSDCVAAGVWMRSSRRCGNNLSAPVVPTQPPELGVWGRSTPHGYYEINPTMAAARVRIYVVVACAGAKKRSVLSRTTTNPRRFPYRCCWLWMKESVVYGSRFVFVSILFACDGGWIGFSYMIVG